jgi:hypothetical protein
MEEVLEETVKIEDQGRKEENSGTNNDEYNF